MDITGTLKVKSETQQIKDTFKKREFVITDNSSQYPQHIQFELTQDKCSLLDNYQVGQEIKVYFNLRGREWTDREGKVRYFNSLQAWKLETAGGGSNNNSSSSSNKSSNEPPMETFSSKSENDDLPF
jgi:hypothetical protein